MAALERALERLRRQKGVGSTLTLKELVDEYLAQHDAEPETIDKLAWLVADRAPHIGDLEARLMADDAHCAAGFVFHPGVSSATKRQ